MRRRRLRRATPRNPRTTDASVKLIVGIGNPGPRYEGTRHNIGFRLLDAFAREHDIAIASTRLHGHFGVGRVGDHDVGLLKPETFVNNTGVAIRAALTAHPEVDFERDLILVYDDLDLPTGRVRLRVRGGAGGHRGVANVIETLASEDFARLRFGVGRPSDGLEAREYVLQNFSAEDEKLLDTQIPLAVCALAESIADGIEAAMSRFNAEAPPAD